MQATQTFEDELKAMIKLNSILLTWNGELEAKLNEEIESKEGNPLLYFYFETISEYTLDWSWSYLTKYKDQLMTLCIIPGYPDWADKAFVDLKVDLDGEKAAQLTAQIEVDVLSRVVKDLKISADKFAPQIPTLEDKVKHLENNVVDGLNEVQARELFLERTTWGNDDYQKQISQLTKKLESKSLGCF
jgi:hypothetical protein